ncbi:hypothetical protein RYX41_06645 [Lactiplantibacillus plantarum]|nr:hypothetical protein [Lactiplantibacillus plantarum]WQC49974.1 hypothetical protein TUW04_13460 [Lactiplantibacillus plantarum]
MVVVFVDDDFPQPTNKIAVAATANNPRIPFFHNSVSSYTNFN